MFDFFVRKLTEFQSNYFKYKKNCQNYFLNFFEKIFLRKFFPTNFFLVKFFLSNFFWRKFLFSQKCFCDDFFHNIFANFFCIRCLPKFFIRNFAYCEFFVLQYWSTEKKLSIFFAIFFSAINVNTKFENVYFLKKSEIFSNPTFGYLE